MFEAEIKYLADAAFVPGGRTLGRMRYHDTYFDSPDGTFYASGRELRLRRVNGHTLLTNKSPAFDPTTGSKEERETVVADPDVMAAILQHFGLVPSLAFTKTCRRFRDAADGLALDITVVRVDFSPHTFVEIEHQAPTRDAALAALATIRAYAARHGLVHEYPICYTELLRAAQQGNAATPHGVIADGTMPPAAGRG